MVGWSSDPDLHFPFIDNMLMEMTKIKNDLNLCYYAHHYAVFHRNSAYYIHNSNTDTVRDGHITYISNTYAIYFRNWYIIRAVILFRRWAYIAITIVLTYTVPASEWHFVCQNCAILYCIVLCCIALLHYMVLHININITIKRMLTHSVGETDTPPS